MRIVKAKEVGEREVERLLTKAAFDEVELNPKIREGNKKLFGKDMSAAELVRMIVSDVRKDGDKAVMHYTKLIDKVDLTPESMLVSEEEFAAAEAAALRGDILSAGQLMPVYLRLPQAERERNARLAAEKSGAKQV